MTTARGGKNGRERNRKSYRVTKKKGKWKTNDCWDTLGNFSMLTIFPYQSNTVVLPQQMCVCASVGTIHSPDKKMRLGNYANPWIINDSD